MSAVPTLVSGTAPVIGFNRNFQNLNARIWLSALLTQHFQNPLTASRMFASGSSTVSPCE